MKILQVDKSFGRRERRLENPTFAHQGDHLLHGELEELLEVLEGAQRLAEREERPELAELALHRRLHARSLQRCQCL